MEQGFQRLGIAIGSWSLWATDSPVSNRAASQKSEQNRAQKRPDPAGHREALTKTEIAVQISGGSNVAIAKGEETITAPVRLQ